MFMNNMEESSLQHPNMAANISQMDCEGFQDLRKWCNPNDILSSRTPIIDDEFEYLFDDMANTPKTIDSERISRNLCTDFLNAGCTRYQSNPDVTTDAVTNTILDDSIPEAVFDNYVYIALPSNQSTSPDFEDEVEIVDNQSYASSPEYGVFYENDISSNNFDNNYPNNVEVSSTSNSFITSDSVFALDSDNKNFNLNNSSSMSTNSKAKRNNMLLYDNEESYDRSQTTINYDSVTTECVQDPFSLIDIKNNNDTIINDIIINGKYDLKSDAIKNNATVAKLLNLKLECKDPFYNSEIWETDIDVTTPDIYKTIEQLETDMGLNQPYVTDYVPTSTIETMPITFTKTSKKVDCDYSCTLTPPDTPKTRISKRRRDSEDEDVSYVPPSKKKSHTVNITPLKTVKLGRPPKQIENVCSPASFTTDDNSMASPDDIETIKRQRNNEASKRSRYNRKVKDMQMVNVADDLETRNDQLRIDLVKLERKISRLRKLVFDFMVKK